MGREQELRSIERGFQAGHRLQTLVGPPGIGKTRLAAEYLRSATDTEPVWVSLESGGDSHGLRVAVARALGLEIAASDDESKLDGLIGLALRSRGDCTIALDHIDEHVEAAAPTLASWLAATPSVRFLATSCRVLRIRGETPIEVGPLQLPPESTATIEQLREHEAGLCLLALSRRSFSDGDARTLAELARQLDGIPLAIELAAWRLAVLTPRELLDRLSARFDVLTIGPRDANARHATLRAAIDWSWDQLEPGERQVLAQCTAFRGGFTLRAAERVVEPHDKAGAVVDVVQALIEKSMLRARRTEISEAQATLRFDFFTTIRDYVTTQTNHAAELQSAQRRHLRYFANVAREQLAPDVSEDDALAQSGAEFDNLVAAWRQSTTLPPQPDHLADESDILRALARAVLNRRPANEYAEMLTTTLGRHAEASVARGHLLVCRSRCYQRLGRYVDAQADVDEARDISPTVPALHALVQWRLGVLARVAGDADKALAHLTTALEGARSASDLTLHVLVLEQLAYCHASACRIREGLACADEALARARDQGSTSLGAEAHNARLLLLARSGRLSDGIKAYRDTAAMYRASGELISVGYADVSVSLIHQELGDYDTAEEHLRTALSVASHIGVARLQALAHGNLGAVRHEAGAWEPAAEHYTQAIDIYHSLEDRSSEAEYQGHLCALLATTRDVTGARRARERVAELAPNPPPHMQVAFDIFGAQIHFACSRDKGERQQAYRLVGVAPTDVSQMTLAWGQQRLADAAARSEVVRCAIRLLQQTLRRTALAVAADGAWFSLPGQPNTELSNRAALSRLLAALFARYIEAPGESVANEDLVSAGWPNERMTKASAANRLKNAMSTLRKLGLGSRVVSGDRGYLLDPQESIVCASWLKPFPSS